MSPRLLLIFLPLIALSFFFLDGPVASWVAQGPTDNFLKARGLGRSVATVLKLPGEAWVMLVCTVLIALLPHGRSFNLRLRLSICFLIGCLLSSSNAVIKWIVGRHRPFRSSDTALLQPYEFIPFRGGLAGLFDQQNLSFPSGHASLAFALATGLALTYPKLRILFFSLAAACALERVAENAHYLSEAIAGAALGMACAWLVYSYLAPTPRYDLPSS